MSVYINNKSLNVQVKNTDYSKDSTLLSILAKLTTSPENPLFVDLAVPQGIAMNATVQDTNTKLDALNTSVSSVISDSALNINRPTASGLLLDGMSLLSAGDASSAVTPVGTLNTIFGVCSLVDTVDSVNLTVQFSNDGMVWFDTMNTLNVAQNQALELTFWSAAKMFRCTVDQNCKLTVLYGSR